MNSRIHTYAASDLPQLLRESARLTVDSPSALPITQAMLAHGGQERKSQEPAFFDQINLDEALQIYSIVRSIEPENTLEIGFCCGGSGLAILKALEDAGKGIHHAVDPYQASYAQGQGVQNVQAAGLDHRFRLFEDTPENAIADIPRVQFAFIDASHLYDLSMLDFVLTDKRLDNGGVLALHDLWMPSLRKLARYILANRHYELLEYGKHQMPGTIRLRYRLKKIWSRFARHFPFLASFVAPEALYPWCLFDAGNLVFLKKLKEDDRDWRFHKDF